MCSRSFPLNSSANGSGERSTHEERECERIESQDDTRERRGESERERYSHDEKGGTGENWKALRRMARLCGCRAREIERKREKEGRMEREIEEERKRRQLLRQNDGAVTKR